MTTTTLNPCLSLRDLVQLDVSIGRQIQEKSPATDPEGCRLLLRQRRWVRDQIESRRTAESN